MEKAVTLVMLQPPAPAREPTAWTHVPSQPLMRSLLSQILTPTAPRRVSRFFRVRSPFTLPRRADHPAYFGLAKFYLSQPFQPSTWVKLNVHSSGVNAISGVHQKYLWVNCGKAGLIVEGRSEIRVSIGSSHSIQLQNLQESTSEGSVYQTRASTREKSRTGDSSLEGQPGSHQKPLLPRPSQTIQKSLSDKCNSRACGTLPQQFRRNCARACPEQRAPFAPE